MRIMIKGGVWKNTEDEILKAAVMKYGKNQWARISSLLVRKSAKQCKARWYEWLDPSIKKTEWTREEDEKLLHLAKLMPTQWRTIAPIVGRTPSQCLERYEKLLDAACSKDENYEPADDPRKLRPGEIDPNPESKPARPDPVDMDEDEKEMLSEARARLANTRGKKAKRKAREKQLEEARRLASLQKRRELKAAGIEGKQRKRRRRGIDYNAEIPFEKKPPPGFYDVADEERPVEQPKFPTTIEEIEGKRRVDIEAQLRKQDTARNKILQRHDAPAAVMQVNKLNDPESVRKRSKLMLPPPQISDRELEEIAKMGYAGDALGDEELAGGSGAARALLANYGQTPRLGTTPLRTPQRTPGGKGDAIMMEAENQARLRQSQTPLFGGENPELHPSDFSGVTPRKREIQTPNPMVTPLRTPTTGASDFTPRIGMTPSREFSVTPKGTPIRDGLHINDGLIETPDSAMSESRRQAEIRRQLQEGWGSIPAPQNEYEIVPPELPKEEAEAEEGIEEDMSDRIARQKAEEAARQAALLRKRSKVLQRDLPRPPSSAIDTLKSTLTSTDDDSGSFTPSYLEQADDLIKKELVTLLEHDNAKYPIERDFNKEKKKGSKSASNGKPKMPVPEIEDFEEEEIKDAAKLIEEEVSVLRVGMGHEGATLEDFVEAHDTCLEDMMYFPGRNSYGPASVASVSDKLSSFQNEFDLVRKHMEGETKKAVRLESKLKLLTQGYNMRAEKLWGQIETAFKQADTSWTELECFRALHKQEQLAATKRIEELKIAVDGQKELERKLQFRYKELSEEQERLQKYLMEQKEKLAHQKEMMKIAKEQEKVDQMDKKLDHTGEMEEKVDHTEEMEADHTDQIEEKVDHAERAEEKVDFTDKMEEKFDHTEQVDAPEGIAEKMDICKDDAQQPENDSSVSDVSQTNEILGVSKHMEPVHAHDDAKLLENGGSISEVLKTDENVGISNRLEPSNVDDEAKQQENDGLMIGRPQSNDDVRLEPVNVGDEATQEGNDSLMSGSSQSKDVVEMDIPSEKADIGPQQSDSEKIEQDSAMPESSEIKHSDLEIDNSSKKDDKNKISEVTMESNEDIEFRGCPEFKNVEGEIVDAAKEDSSDTL